MKLALSLSLMRGTFTKFDERDPDTNFFDDVTKSNFDASYFKPNEWNRTFEVHSIWKNVMSFMSIFEVLKPNFDNLKELLEECELVSNIVCVSETWCSNTELQNNSNFSLAGFDFVPYEE